VPVTSAGAATATGRTAIGLRTLCPRRSLQLSAPNDHWPNASVVRVMSTLNVTDLRGGTTMVDGVTVTVNPGGAWTRATYTLALAVAFVTVRVIVCFPARSPTAIEA